VIVQGRQVILDARSAASDEIKTGERVKIATLVGDSIVTVEKI